MGTACQLWLAAREMLKRKNPILRLWKRTLLLVFSSPSFLNGPINDLLCSVINPTATQAHTAFNVGAAISTDCYALAGSSSSSMATGLVQHAIDHRHAERLAAALALSEHFNGDRFHSISSTHAPDLTRRLTW